MVYEYKRANFRSDSEGKTGSRTFKTIVQKLEMLFILKRIYRVRVNINLIGKILKNIKKTVLSYVLIYNCL